MKSKRKLESRDFFAIFFLLGALWQLGTNIVSEKFGDWWYLLMIIPLALVTLGIMWIHYKLIDEKNE